MELGVFKQLKVTSIIFILDFSEIFEEFHLCVHEYVINA